MVLEPERVRAWKSGQGLAAFGRKRVTVGGLTAIVPGEMVVIDDSFRQQPDLYDGISREAKITYLLKTLTEAQWKLAAGSGIGEGDLQGEQKAVFRSILPQTLKWNAYRVGSGINQLAKEDQGNLSETQIERVRLRISRRLDFRVELAQERGYTMHSTDESWGSPGDLILVRDDEEELKAGSTFGVKVRQAVPNKSKPSDLDYRAKTLDPMLAVPDGASIRDVLRLAGSATGIEIHPDVRVGDRKVRLMGGQVRSGDVLQALALAVTGTYRKVGPAYVLTSDLMGMGTRRLRFTIWNENLREDTQAKEREWRRSIADKMRMADFLPGDPYAPDDVWRNRLKSEKAIPDYVPATELTPAMRSFLEETNRRYAHQPIKTDKAGVATEFQYGFVLPDGRALRPERVGLASTAMFLIDAANAVRRAPPEKPIPAQIKPDGPTIPAIVSLEGSGDVGATLSDLASRGIREVWVEVYSADRLKTGVAEAKKLGMAVRLYLRPWTAVADNDPDRTILGHTGADIDRFASGQLAWQRYLSEEAVAYRPAYEKISPLDPARSNRWKALIELAKTPGLEGVVLGDTQPLGYEPAHDRASYGSYEPPLAHVRNLGYSTAARLAFLRAQEIDPLDVADPLLAGGPDIRQPFFLDDALRGIPSVYDGRDNPHPAMRGMFDRWVEFRSKANGQAVTELATSIANACPVMIEVRSSMANRPEPNFDAFFPWAPKQPLPTTPSDQPMRIPVTQEMVGRIHVSPSWPLLDRDNGPFMLQAALQQKRFVAVLDASDVPQDKLKVVLDRWLKPLH